MFPSRSNSVAEMTKKFNRSPDSVQDDGAGPSSISRSSTMPTCRQQLSIDKGKFERIISNEFKRHSMSRIKFPEAQKKIMEMSCSTNSLEYANDCDYWKDKYEKLLIKYNELKKEKDKLWEFINKVDEKKRDKLYLKLLYRPALEFLQKKNIIKNEPCFNAELNEVEVHEAFQDIPKIVVECIKLIENNDKFIKTTGIYRVSGDHKVIQSLRYQINSGQYDKLRSMRSPHEITGILKLFIRELKKPLISLELFKLHVPQGEDFIHQTLRNKLMAIKNLVSSIQQFPGAPRTFKTINYLMKHLKNVAANSDINQMDAHSLSIVIGSCVLYETLSDILPKNLLQISKVPNHCVQLMIENYNEIFNDNFD